jgi:hypothetical protein
VLLKLVNDFRVLVEVKRDPKDHGENDFGEVKADKLCRIQPLMVELLVGHCQGS